MSLTQDFERVMLGQSADLFRYEQALRIQILSMLAQLQSQLAADISLGGMTEWKMNRLNRLLKAATDTINGNMSSISSFATKQLGIIANLEASNLVKNLNAVMKVELLEQKMSPAFLNKLASNLMIEGELNKKWWSLQGEDLRNRFTQQMRMGVMRGEGVDQLVRRVVGYQPRTKDAEGNRLPPVPGIMDTTRRRAEALVRTSVIAVANEVNLETFRDNDDVIKGIKWVSTLDGRTTPICQFLDGKQWDLEGHPLNGAPAFPGPTAHWNCRSTQVPVTYSFEELSKLAHGGNRKVARALDDMPESTRASMDGQVGANLTYADWWGGLTDQRRKEIGNTTGPKPPKVTTIGTTSVTLGPTGTALEEEAKKAAEEAKRKLEEAKRAAEEAAKKAAEEEAARKAAEEAAKKAAAKKVVTPSDYNEFVLTGGVPDELKATLKGYFATLEELKVDRRLITVRRVDSLGYLAFDDNRAAGYYRSYLGRIEINSFGHPTLSAKTRVLTHEHGHHIDYTFLQGRASGHFQMKATYKEMAALREEAIAEFKHINSFLEKGIPGFKKDAKLGAIDRINKYRKDMMSVTQKEGLHAPSMYALTNDREWIAECWEAWIKDPGRAAKLFPRTVAVFEKLAAGELFV